MNRLKFMCTFDFMALIHFVVKIRRRKTGSRANLKYKSFKTDF